MTDLVEPIATTLPLTRILQNPSGPALVLSGPGPFLQVFVKVDNTDTAFFSTALDPVDYTWINWQHAKDVSTNAQITFAFSGRRPITRLQSLSSGLSFEPVTAEQQVASCSPTVSPPDYQFEVISGALAIDPVIVVSIPPADGGS
jgi:hypothetical protein